MNHRIKFTLCLLAMLAVMGLMIWAFAHFNITASERYP